MRSLDDEDADHAGLFVAGDGADDLVGAGGGSAEGGLAEAVRAGRDVGTRDARDLPAMGHGIVVAERDAEERARASRAGGRAEAQVARLAPEEQGARQHGGSERD